MRSRRPFSPLLSWLSRRGDRAWGKGSGLWLLLLLINPIATLPAKAEADGQKQSPAFDQPIGQQIEIGLADGLTDNLADDLANSLADGLLKAEALRDRGDWLAAVQQYQAVVQNSQAIVQSSRAETGVAAKHQLARLLIDLAREEEAVPLLEQALAHYRQTQKPLKQAKALIDLGAAYDYLSLSHQSRDAIQQGLKLLTEPGKQPGGQTQTYREVLSKSIFEAGKVNLLLGQSELGIELLQESIQLAQELDNPQREAASYTLLAYGLNLNRQTAEAQAVLKAGRSQLEAVLERQTLSPPETLRTIAQLGINQLFSGNYAAAEQQFEQAIQGYQSLGFEQLMGEQWNQLGNLYAIMPRYQQSITAYQQALAVFEQLGDRRRMVENLNSLSSSYSLVGDQNKMLQARVDALEALRSLRQSVPTHLAPSLEQEAEMLSGLGEAQVNLGEYDAAVESFEQAIAL